GKSTLVKILSGVYTKDGGTILVDGKDVGDLTPRSAQALGISIIHQELNMCTHLTVAENIFLGKEVTKAGGVLAHKEMNRRAAEVLNSLNIDIAPEEIVSSLAVSKQQMVEIAKAIAFDANVLIMDEPTSALSDKEIEDLFRIIHLLRERGCAIVYISHRLAELEHIVDEVTIMRDSKFIRTCKFNEITLDEIITDMVGRKITEQFPHEDCEVGEVVFEVEHLNAGRMVRDVSFSLRAGEVVSLAGLMGAGRTETTRAIFGADPKASGTIRLNGKEISIKSPADAIHHGVVLAPEDRRKDGLCVGLSVKDNLSLPNMDIVANAAGVVSGRKEKALANRMVADLMIKLPNTDVNAASLSGGNQQKVVIGKWLARNSKVVIFDEPTRGIDVAAKVEIHNLMNKLKKAGIAVLFVSSELPEVMGIADRILVMCDGRITGELSREEATQEKIMEYATSFEQKLEQKTG
ncbi:MAG: sugar ABC transporter ATP-binding protein, partial [Oscillospiraceae bacterium]